MVLSVSLNLSLNRVWIETLEFPEQLPYASISCQTDIGVLLKVAKDYVEFQR